MAIALAVAGREGNRAGKAGRELAASDATDERCVGIGLYAAIVDPYRRFADRDVTAHGGAETPMLADEARVVEGKALRLRFVAEPEIAEIETAGLASAAPRREMRENRAIGVPQAGHRCVEIAARVGDPIFAVDRQLDRKLVVVRVRAAPAMSDGAAPDGKEEPFGAEYPQAKIGKALAAQSATQIVARRDQLAAPAGIAARLGDVGAAGLRAALPDLPQHRRVDRAMAASAQRGDDRGVEPHSADAGSKIAAIDERGDGGDRRPMVERLFIE